VTFEGERKEGGKLKGKGCWTLKGMRGEQLCIRFMISERTGYDG